MNMAKNQNSRLNVIPDAIVIKTNAKCLSLEQTFYDLDISLNSAHIVNVAKIIIH